MSDDHNKADPERDWSEVVHTEFGDWKTLPPGAVFNFRGSKVGHIVPFVMNPPREVDESDKLFFLGVRSEEKLAFFDNLKRAYEPGKERSNSFLGWHLLTSHYTSHTDEILNYDALKHKSHFSRKLIMDWIGISNSLHTGTLLRFYDTKKNFYLMKKGYHLLYDIEQTGRWFSSLILRAIRKASADPKIDAYTTKYYPNMDNFSLQLEHSLPIRGPEDHFYFRAEPEFMLNGLLQFGNLAPHFMNVTTVRLELVYDLITDGYEIDLPGDGSDLTPHTLEEQWELPVQLPLMLEKVVLTFIRNKEHLGRPLTYRLRRITDDIENEGSGKK